MSKDFVLLIYLAQKHDSGRGMMAMRDDFEFGEILRETDRDARECSSCTTSHSGHIKTKAN